MNDRRVVHPLPTKVPLKLGGATFPVLHRVRRFIWYVVWACLGKWSPRPMFGWRRLLVTLFGGKIAQTARIYNNVDIWDPANLDMAVFACLGPGVNAYTMAKITLAPRALVSQGAHLCCGTHDVDVPEFPLVTSPITLMEDCWIAAETFVGPGVTVGPGAVLGARAVTFLDLAPWTIYAGKPATPKRKRKIAPSDSDN